MEDTQKVEAKEMCNRVTGSCHLAADEFVCCVSRLNEKLIFLFLLMRIHKGIFLFFPMMMRMRVKVPSSKFEVKQMQSSPFHSSLESQNILVFDKISLHSRWNPADQKVARSCANAHYRNGCDLLSWDEFQKM